MGFNASQWVNELALKLKDTFADRLLFVGLQGSYRRGEAKPTSDIDVVVILDEVTIDDLKKYKDLIQSMPEKEKACGFISGKREINNWPAIDIFQFQNDTLPISGSLDGLVPVVEKKDIDAYVKNSCANLYHMAVHSYLYDKNNDNLTLIVKSLFFLFQAIYFLRTGVYVSSKHKLCTLLAKDERAMLEINASCVSAGELEKVYDGIIKYTSNGFCREKIACFCR